MSRKSFATLIGAALLASTAYGQSVQRYPLPKIFDYWVTPSGSGTSLPLDIPAGFFGPGSDALNTTVSLEGLPFGPGGGQGLPANADTSIRRKADPNVSQVGDSDTVQIKFKGLSLISESPVIVTYGGSNPQAWDVHIGLSDIVNPVWGSLTATLTFNNGGTFDSSLPIVWKATFTPAGGGNPVVLDSGDAQWGIQPGHMQAVAVPWVKSMPGMNGGFHPGYNPDMSAAQAAYAEYSQNEDHVTEPCEDCPDDGGIEPEPIDVVVENESGATDVGQQ